MERSISPITPKFGAPNTPPLAAGEALISGVSWAAIAAGGFVTAALSLILLALGSGLGLAAVSPWAQNGVSAAKLSGAGIIGLILLQLIPSAIGGYLAGRLRVKWTTIHSDEVYFRDTAHGFLSWAVAVVFTAAFLASAAVTMAGGVLSSNGGAAATTTSADRVMDPNAYYVDMLFRSDRPASTNDAALRTESGRILANALRQGDMPAADKDYLEQRVVATTGISAADASSRVSNVETQARIAADDARRATSHLLLWMFISLLIGAFCACVAATLGGSQRDHVKMA